MDSIPSHGTSHVSYRCKITNAVRVMLIEYCQLFTVTYKGHFYKYIQ